MAKEYLTIARPADVEIEIKRSRFLAQVRRVDDEAAARAEVERCRKEFWDARHHCSAFVLGPSAMIARSNDDGEPAGTAGAPILAAITGRELSDVVVVVIRYFGGILLGAGGLVRAYTDATVSGLDAAGVVRRREALLVTATVAIADVGKVEHSLRGAGLDVSAVDYAVGNNEVRIVGALDEDDRAAVDVLLANLTSGRQLEVTGTTWRDL